MPTTTVKPIADRLRKQAENTRLNVTKARELLEEVETIKTEVETFVDLDVTSDTIETLTTALEALDVLVTAGLQVLKPGVLDQLRAAVDTLQAHWPDTDDLGAIVEAYDEADLAVTTCEDHRDSERGDYDVEDKQMAREDAQTAFETLADAIGTVEA